MGPIEAILDALQENMSLALSEDYSFSVDRETGDVNVEVYSNTPDGVKIDSSIVRLSTVKVDRG